MDIRKKLELFETQVRSISRHDDEDSKVIDAALDKAQQIIEAERALMHARAADRIAQQVG